MNNSDLIRVNLMLNKSDYEKFKAMNKNVSAEIREFMSIRVNNLDEKTQLEAQMEEYEIEKEKIAERLKNIAMTQEIVEVEEINHDEKLNEILDTIHAVAENQGEISEPQIQRISAMQDISFLEIMGSLNNDFKKQYVKKFEDNITQVDYL